MLTFFCHTAKYLDDTHLQKHLHKHMVHYTIPIEVMIMHATAAKETSIKYTAVLPKTCIDELKYLAGKKIVPSVSQGIRLAIESFVAFQKQQEYVRAMEEATNDNAFMLRTMDTHNDFSAIDDEEGNTW